MATKRENAMEYATIAFIIVFGFALLAPTFKPSMPPTAPKSAAVRRAAKKLGLKCEDIAMADTSEMILNGTLRGYPIPPIIAAGNRPEDRAGCKVWPRIESDPLLFLDEIDRPE